MISKELSTTLSFAVREAKRRRHEYVCVEHVLYAILHDKHGISIIENCGGEIDTIKNTVESFFNEKLESIDKKKGDYVLQQTIGFQRLIQRAVNHVRSAEKKQVELGDIIASIFLEKESHAAFFLNSAGITRLNVLNYISHSVDSEDYDQNKEHDTKDKIEKKSDEKDPLKLYAVDLIEKASEGRIDPLIGRSEEIERALQILCRRRKNNPVFVGDPGVGKTAIAEGIAKKIFEVEIPEIMKGVSMYSLDMGSLLAGTKFRGDFEKRLKGVINRLKSIDKAILFIDEIHTIVGAGATNSGTMDASNILKPVLSSGEIKCIGSSTYEEYKNHFEKDRALSRRFEKIDVTEPSIEESIEILFGLRSCYEEHHGIKYSDEALESAVELSAKHINDRYLPDKAIDVIDETGAFLKISGKKNKKTIVPEDIEKTIAKIAKVPTKTVSVSDRAALENLNKGLKKVVFGQDSAIESIVTSIKRSRAGLGIPEKPIGSFLFTGPTGVGKTEVARQLAFTLGVNFLRFDMSEYMEKHAVARLIGAPPGYVGFEQGGLLTDGIRKKPYTVLLLDEIEKAHMDLFNILLQVMDYATLTDNNGKKADFRNVILIMTSNAGAREMSSKSIGFGNSMDVNVSKGNQAVEKAFSPEFRNRLDDIITFNALNMDSVELIVSKLIKELRNQLKVKDVSLKISKKARLFIADKGFDKIFGARPLQRVIQKDIKDILTDEILFGKLKTGGSVSIGLKNKRLSFNYKINV